MKKVLIAGICLIITAAFGVTTFAGKKDSPKNAKATKLSVPAPAVGTDIGMTAPDFVMNDQNGKPLMLSQFKGKVIVLDFWATWCGPCRRELPHFKELWGKYKSKDVVFIGISLDKDLEKWKQFIKTENMDWFHVADGKFWSNAIAQQYGVESIPSVWVIDNMGVIKGKHLYGGEVESTIEQVVSKLNAPAKSAKPSKS